MRSGLLLLLLLLTRPRIRWIPLAASTMRSCMKAHNAIIHEGNAQQFAGPAFRTLCQPQVSKTHDLLVHWCLVVSGFRAPTVPAAPAAPCCEYQAVYCWYHLSANQPWQGSHCHALAACEPCCFHCSCCFWFSCHVKHHKQKGPQVHSMLLLLLPQISKRIVLTAACNDIP